VGVGETISHFSSRGLGTRAASIRGFLQISSPVSSVSPVQPVEARWQLQLITQARLVWEEWEKGVRTRLREKERRLTLKRKEEFSTCPSQHPAAFFFFGKFAKANENKRKNFVFW